MKIDDLINRRDDATVTPQDQKQRSNKELAWQIMQIFF